MPPKGSKRAASPTKAASAVKSSPKKPSSPKKATAVAEPSSPKKSPKKVSLTIKSPANKVPAVKKTSPRKASPKKPAAYKTAMTRDTRGKSAEPAETPAIPLSPAKRSKKASGKRGVYGTQDNDDDPTEPTEEMLAAFDGRSLTKWDKVMIEGINGMEDDEDYEPLDVGRKVFVEEGIASAQNQPLNCHTKIYWRFLDLFTMRTGRTLEDFFSNESSVPPRSPPKNTSGRAASRSPSKPPSPGKATGSRVPPMTRASETMTAFRRPEKITLGKTDRIGRLGRVQGSGITKDKRAPGTKAREQLLTQRQMDSVLISIEEAAYQSVMNGQKVPPLPGNVPQLIANKEREKGLQRGREEQQAEDDSDVSMEDPPDPIQPAPSRPASPGKRAQSPGKQPQSPTKPQSPGKRAQSPAKPQSPGKRPAVASTPVSTPASPIRPKEFGRGDIISSQNPKFINVMRNGKLERQENPFHETMPAPEVWHRRMPPVFPFGETPLMARVVSDQINADLARSKSQSTLETQQILITTTIDHDVDDGPSAAAAPTRTASLTERIAGAVPGVIRSLLSPTKAAPTEPEEPVVRQLASLWELPPVDPEWMEKAREAGRVFKRQNNIHVPSARRTAAAAGHLAQGRFAGRGARVPHSGDRGVFE